MSILISKMGTYIYSFKYHKNMCPCLSLKWVPILIAPNLIKIGVYAYLSNGYPCLSLKWVPIFIPPKNIKYVSMLIYKMGKYFYSSKYYKNRCLGLSLKWVHIFITPNLKKIGVHSYLQNGYLFLELQIS